MLKTRKKDVEFRLFHNNRGKNRHGMNSKMKSSCTLDNLGIDINTNRMWIEYQFQMELNWKNIEVDHVWPFYSFDISNDEKLMENFNWKNTQPLLKQVYHQKRIGNVFSDCLLPFFEAYQFIKLNEERLNESPHWWNILFPTWEKKFNQKNV